MESSNYSKVNLILFLILSSFLPSCNQADNEEEILNYLEVLKEQYVPDTRVGIFDYEIHEGVLFGQTDQKEVLNAVTKYLSAQNSYLIDSLELLPSKSLGAETLAVINVSVANIRSQPGHSQELSTQALLGTPVKVLFKEGGWYKVQTPDGYLGYIENGVLEFNPKEYNSSEKVIYASSFGFVYSRPTLNSPTVSDLSLGGLLGKISMAADYTGVVLPDGRKGYVPTRELMNLADFLKASEHTNIAQLTSRFLGIPYLWGGTSFKGADCSGFTRTVFLNKGIYLPRDASQQAAAGIRIEPGAEFENLLEGDLLFFGPSESKVTHVAVYLGGQRFIHSSGMVRYGSFNRNSPEFDEFNLNRFLFAKRVLGQQNVKYLNANTLY